MKKIKIIIMLMLIAAMHQAWAQSISRKVISSAGGTLTGGSYQITYNIGETVIPSLSAGSKLITQGFEQPGEELHTGAVALTICAGNTFSVPYTAIDIGGGNTFTAQLSDASGSFAAPVSIGTLAGNASGSISVTIPANTPAGTGYRIRVVSSFPAVNGSDNGNNMTINTSPAILATIPLSLNNDAGFCSATVGNAQLMAQVTSVTGTPPPTVTFSPPAGSFPVGTTLVTVSATNSCGSVTSSFNVTVSDNENPVIACPPAVISVNTDPGVCYATGVALGTPVIGDNCAGSTVGNNAPLQFPQGGTFVTWEVTDASGNKADCQQLVSVTDNEPPHAICKNICVNLNSAGVATITAADVNNASWDNCGIDPGPNGIVVSPSSFTYANAGVNTVTLTVKDVNGNTSSCTATVTIGEFYTLFGSTGNCTASPGGPAGCMVNISSGSIVNGNVGSYRLVQTGSTVTINGKVVSGGKVSYGNTVTSGSVSAANNYGQSSTIFSTGGAAHILGDIDVVGDINVNPSLGSTVTGTVRHPSGTTYTGPVPGGGVLTAAPILPALPGMPTTHTYTCGGANINGTAVLNPGSYGNLTPGSGNIITFHGPGNYYFSDINLAQGGGVRTFKYDFMNLPGNINIYVCSNIHLGQIASQWAGPNTPDACRIYFEVQGNGTTNIGQNSQFYGRIWAPYSGVNVGSGTSITGSLWSANKIDFSGAVTVNKCNSPCPPGPRIGDEISTTDAMSEMLRVYPNPTSGKTTVKFFADAPYGYTLKVFDNLGRVVLSKESKAVAGDNTQEIDMSSFAKGLYLIEVGNTDHSQKVKVVVQ